MLAMALLYPLENVRTRLQVQAKRPATPRSPRTAQLYQDWKKLKAVPLFGSTLECIMRVVHEEGWQGLYTGVQSSVTGVGISSFVYFYWYNFMKYVLYERRHKKIMPMDNVVIAAAAGVINVFSTAPFWLVTQRLTLQTKKKHLASTEVKYKGLIDCFRKVIDEEGPLALWDGLVPALALVSNPIIQFACYEQFTRYIVAVNKRRDPKFQLSSFQIFVLGAVAKAIATVATYPTQVIKSRLQVDPNGEHRTYDNVLHCATSMLREEGVSSFYSGMSAKMSQTVMNSAFMFLMYEKIFALFVKAYTISLRVKSRVKGGASS